MSKKSKPSGKILICDTNVVVLMYLFKKSKMFSAKYSYGEVKIHKDVISEIQAWIKKNNNKCKKFGKTLLEDMLREAKKYSTGIKEPTDAQHSRSIKMLGYIENNLGENEKTMALDKTDKTVLIIAYVNKACLATQDKTVLNTAKKSLPKGMSIRFEELVIDLIKQEVLIKADIEEGLSLLDYHNEILNSSLRSKILNMVS